MIFKQLILFATFLLFFTSTSVICDEILDISSNQNDNDGFVIPLLPRINSRSLHHQHYETNSIQQHGVLEEVNEKLGTIIKLVENAFGKTGERIERVEQKMGRFELMVAELNG